MSLFAIRAIPSTQWSSPYPLNLRPKFLTVFMLSAGLVLFGLGEALMLASGFGLSPWMVLADGVSESIGISIGMTTLLISAVVLLFWIPLKQIPGIGTLLNALIIAVTIDLSLPWLPQPQLLGVQVFECIAGILLIGLGSAMYLIAKLGPGPRDGLMTGLQRITNFPIAWVRSTIEIAVGGIGWLLGGTVWFGTILFAVGVGPALVLGIFIVTACFKETTEQQV